MTHNNTLERKLKEWYGRPEIKRAGWGPRLFWRGSVDDPFATLRIDAQELEVFFATLLGETSAEAEALDRRTPGRSAFIVANARRHELPLFTPR